MRELVTAAVERRLISDVPLGAFLSGGVDSTIIVGLMSQLLAEPVRTFSIGFEGDPAFDETAAAQETAGEFGTAHTEFRVKPSAIDLMDTLVHHHDGPFADSSAIPTYLVSKLTREHVTVALPAMAATKCLPATCGSAPRFAAEQVPAWAGGDGGGRLVAVAAERAASGSRGRRFARFMSLPLRRSADRLVGRLHRRPDRPARSRPRRTRRAGSTRAGIFACLAGIDGASPLNQLLATNFHSYLHDDLLVKADRMTMANSLEARAPFLDRALLEYAAALPDRL